LPLPWLWLIGAALFAVPAAAAAEPSREQLDFFESRVRPVLAEHCYECHGVAAQKAGLRLDSRVGWQRGGDSGPAILAADPDASPLLVAVRHADPKLAMPKGKPKLPDAAIAALAQWVRMGAPDPREAEPALAGPAVPATQLTGITDEQRAFWSFQPVRRVEPPQVKDATWPRGGIDQFVLARLEEQNLRPSNDADKLRLLRRLTLDLTGLPPTPEAIAAFEGDTSTGAIERVVYGLLASPEFGERWGRHWLDVTYFADTTGIGRRSPLRDAWRYRDYVIDAFNRDKPFDQFVREQLAGDALRRGSEGDLKKQAEQITATGFLTLGPWPLFNPDRLQVQADIVDLQLDLVGRTFLGMTIGCARCHDHMFDPIPARDYYALAGIFRSTQVVDPKGGGLTAYNRTVFPADAEDLRRQAEERAAWEALLADLKAKQDAGEQRKAEIRTRLAALNGAPPVQPVPPTSPGSAAAPPITAPSEEERKAEVAKLEAEVRQIDADIAQWKHREGFHKVLPPLPAGAFAAEEHEFPDDARIQLRGNVRALGEQVPRGFLSVVSMPETPAVRPRSSGRRELADWIVSTDNPLTARVYVNRLWHHLFGRGIVASVDNFGTRGDLPTHPALLDYLATRLVEHGWSTKKMIREIVLSRTYQQASDFRSDAHAIDPDNALLWRMAPRRLEAEAIRDAVLFASGRLDRTRGGPTLPLTEKNLFQIEPVFIEDSAEVGDEIAYRRSVYLPVLRGSQLDAFDMLSLFDFADPDQVVAVRATTTVSLQSLFLMNAPFMKDASRRLAERVLAEPGLDDAGRVARLHVIALNRPATADEIRQAQEFLAAFQAGLGGPSSQSAGVEAWARYAHALLGSAEFLYRG
jgi:mono/diheme cytochrome c family protein